MKIANGSVSGSANSSSVPSLAIVHVVSSLAIGGMEQVVLRLAVAQAKAGHRVSVLTLRGGALEEEARRQQLRVHVLQAGRVGRGVGALRYMYSEGPDIVHAHNPTALHYAVLARLVSRAAVVATIHGDQETHARLGTALEWRLTSAVAVVSEAARNSLRLPCPPEKLWVIYNGIAPSSSDAGRRDAVRSEVHAGASFLGVIVARIDGRKGHATLLESLRLLRNANVDVVLLVVGDGAERNNLERQAGNLGLTGIARFLGARSDVDSLLDAADFFVLPSDAEGLPLSLLEAMIHGLPIVASRVGGVPELIQDGTHGILVPPGDPQSLACAIRRLAEDRSLCSRLGASARARASEKFSLGATAGQYDQLYQRALTRSAA
jgi:glycosyltransferase involved in cell wall biosynthesis